MENDPKRLVDGFLALDGGVVSDRAANLINKNQAAWMENMTVRKGFARPRPPYHYIKLLSEVPLGRFQHAAFFPGVSPPQLMLANDGRIYSISCSDFSVRDVTPSVPNQASQRIGWSVTAEKWWIYQDNDSKALIYDGSSARRADARAFEVPVGNVMAYAQGRLVVALKNRMTFRVGDLVMGPSGTSANEYRDSVLKFTETTFANEGGDFITRIFSGPSNTGPITSMVPTVSLNTAIGQGPLLVGTQNCIFSIVLPFDRTVWKDTQSVLQAVAMYGKGTTGQDSCVVINSDVWYRAFDGWRSFFLTIRNTGQWGNTVQSMEVERAWEKDPEWLLQFLCGVQFDNRLLVSTNPIITEYGVYSQGLIPLDFDLLSSLNGKANPVWEGVWNGLKILKAVTGTVDNVERCFVFVLNDDSRIELWEVLKEGKDDDGYPIPQLIETARYAFTTPNPFGVSTPNNFTSKRLDGAQLFLDSIQGEINGVLEYREDGNKPWHDWATFSLCASDCGVPDPPCSAPPNLQQQTRVKVRFPTPPDITEDTGKRFCRVAFDFQARLQITGSARITGFRLLAYEEQEFPYFEPTSSDCIEVDACVDAPTPTPEFFTDTIGAGATIVAEGIIIT